MTQQHGILAICSAAAKENLNLTFAAMGGGPATFSRKIAAAAGITTSTTPTHYGMYDATAGADMSLIYDQAKLGFLPNEDVNGNPIYWGVGGVISAADAVAAFQAMEFWLNSSDMLPTAFAAALLAQKGLAYVPDEE